jgi:SAM-dependent methyltransferase
VDEITARRARSFGPIATTYDRVRPGYPHDAVEWLLADHSRPGNGASLVLDLGAGTGALTRDLVALGHKVVAVEPDPEMRSVLMRRLPGTDVRAGSAEDLPLGDGEIDAVLGGQMWHWVHLDRAVPEVARVLRPGGTLGLLWNFRDEHVPWMAELGAILGGDDVHGGPAQVVLPEGAPFTARAARDFPWAQELVPGDIVDLVATRSHVQVMAPDQRDALLAKVATLVATHSALSHQDRIRVPYVTSCWRATRT